MSYPDYWLCKTCHRPFKKHMKIGQKDYSPKGRKIYTANNEWCFSQQEIADKNLSNTHGAFIPMDNLTLIEFLAKAKGINKEIPKSKADTKSQ